MIICHFYLIIVIASLHFLLILLEYKWNNEISTWVTTGRIVIINIEKKNEMIRKKSVEIKRFIKEYVALSLYYANFIMDAHGCSKKERSRITLQKPLSVSLSLSVFVSVSVSVSLSLSFISCVSCDFRLSSQLSPTKCW